MEDLAKVREEVSLWGNSWLFKVFKVKSGPSSRICISQMNSY